MANLSGYKKDMDYLKQKSDQGTLLSNNGIYQKLDSKAKNLKELRSFLNSLNVKYV